MFKTQKFVVMAAAGALALTMGLSGCGEKQTAEAPAAETTAEAPAEEATAEAEVQAEAQPEAAPEAQPETTQEAPVESESEATAPAQVDPQKSAPPAQAPASPDEYIGYDEAKRIALTDAGLNEADCRKLEVELDTDDYYVHYDVEFEAGTYEYDYDIDAVTGEIIFSRAEYDD